MELTYQSPLMPASYTALSADEMTYIDGGAIQIGSYLIEFHPEAPASVCGQLHDQLWPADGQSRPRHSRWRPHPDAQGRSDSVPVGLLLLGWPEQGRQSCPLWRSALSLAGTAQCRLSRSITRSSPSSSSSRMLTRRPRQILPRPSSRMPASLTPSWLQLPESV